jgi:hypothetical protein
LLDISFVQQLSWEQNPDRIHLVTLLVINAMEKVQQVANSLVEKVSDTHLNDYVNALVFNQSGHALIFETPRQGGSGVFWQVMSQSLPTDSDPLKSVQAALLHKTGYQTSHWSYLGSHFMATNGLAGASYFFCGQQANQMTRAQIEVPKPIIVKWVPLSDLRYALLDGRIASVTHALTVSLTLLTLHP